MTLFYNARSIQLFFIVLSGAIAVGMEQPLRKKQKTKITTNIVPSNVLSLYQLSLRTLVNPIIKNILIAENQRNVSEIAHQLDIAELLLEKLNNITFLQRDVADMLVKPTTPEIIGDKKSLLHIAAAAGDQRTLRRLFSLYPVNSTKDLFDLFFLEDKKRVHSCYYALSSITKINPAILKSYILTTGEAKVIFDLSAVEIELEKFGIPFSFIDFSETDDEDDKDTVNNLTFIDKAQSSSISPCEAISCLEFRHHHQEMLRDYAKNALARYEDSEEDEEDNDFWKDITTYNSNSQEASATGLFYAQSLLCSNDGNKHAINLKKNLPLWYDKFSKGIVAQLKKKELSKELIVEILNNFGKNGIILIPPTVN